MDAIEKVMLERIKFGNFTASHFCSKTNSFVEFKVCFGCSEMDNDGHCDYQEGI